jgi:lipopolysaccharide export system permease protein
MGVNANVPYRRETFSTKRIVLDFDGDFNMVEMGGISTDARAKSMSKILHDLDSIREFNDSVGHEFYDFAKFNVFRIPALSKEDSLRAVTEGLSDKTNIDSIYIKLPGEKKQEAVSIAMNDVQVALNDMEFKAEYSDILNREDRNHQMEAINKVTLSLSCLIFFFIGAPLGAIIRKGGLGVPVIISVLVFIIFYILDNTGMKMARDDNWTVWFGKLLGTAVLSPIAIFFTYKANNDSVVFNVDLYKNMLRHMLGLRTKRNITRKEVIIEDPKYTIDAQMLKSVDMEIALYGEQHHLLRWPNPIKVFFRPGDDHEIETINSTLEMAIEDLAYTKNNYVLMKLNQYPIIATHAHTRPFRKKWLNAVTGIFLPTGIFFYVRMIRFRIRLYRDLQNIRRVNKKLIPRVIQLGQGEKFLPAEDEFLL